MDLVFITEARFEKDANGNIYSLTGSYNLKLWSRYLDKFDRITIIARIKDSETSHASELLASSEKVSFVALPYYIGISAFLKSRKEVIKILNKQAIFNRAYLCRIPGILGYSFASILKKRGIKYGVEVVGDPWDLFSQKTFRNKFAPFLRIFSYLSLRRVVKDSSAALYVTQKQLQKRYPTSKGIFSTSASNVVLPDKLILDDIRIFEKKSTEKIKILSVGYLDQMYKSPDIAIDAIGILKANGFNCHLTWVGDGFYKESMIDYANFKGLSDRIEFVGKILPSKVRDFLLDTDLFILISRTEGLPRAIIEAMGAGLPCIGTRVGGIPELLDESALVGANDAKAVAKKIEHFILNKNFANYHARRNLYESKYYKESILKKKREDFYDEIIKKTNENINLRQTLRINHR